jgi:hypothetical protein
MDLELQRGALYPWLTINGIESTVSSISCTTQMHINADIAYAIKMYFDVSKDMSLMRSGGAAVVLATLLASVFLAIPIALVTSVYEGPVVRVTAATLIGGLEAVVVALLTVSFRMRLSVAMTLTLTTAIVLLGRLDLLVTDMVNRGIFGAGTLIIRAVQSIVPHLWLTDWTTYALAPSRPLPALWEVFVHVALYAGAIFCVGLVWHRQADFAKDSH